LPTSLEVAVIIFRIASIGIILGILMIVRSSTPKDKTNTI
jgi:hypothetical protein